MPLEQKANINREDRQPPPMDAHALSSQECAPLASATTPWFYKSLIRLDPLKARQDGFLTTALQWDGYRR